MATIKGKLKTSNGDIMYPETSADKVSGLSTVATSGSYNDLSNKPTIPTDYVKGVQLNGTPIVDGDGVANIPLATESQLGVVKSNSTRGVYVSASGQMSTVLANDSDIVAKTNTYKPIVPSNLDKAVMEGLGNNSLTWSDTYKTSARTKIDAQRTIDSTHKVSADLIDASTSTNKFVTTSEKTTWNGKQDAISDLTTIRNNASTGASKISANNPTITITQGGTTKGSFTLNQTGNQTIALDSGGGGSYVAGNGINISNNVISVDTEIETDSATLHKTLVVQDDFDYYSGKDNFSDNDVDTIYCSKGIEIIDVDNDETYNLSFPKASGTLSVSKPEIIIERVKFSGFGDTTDLGDSDSRDGSVFDPCTITITSNKLTSEQEQDVSNGLVVLRPDYILNRWSRTTNGRFGFLDSFLPTFLKNMLIPVSSNNINGQHRIEIKIDCSELLNKMFSCMSRPSFGSMLTEGEAEYNDAKQHWEDWKENGYLSYKGNPGLYNTPSYYKENRYSLWHQSTQTMSNYDIYPQKGFNAYSLFYLKDNVLPVHCGILTTGLELTANEQEISLDSQYSINHKKIGCNRLLKRTTFPKNNIISVHKSYDETIKYDIKSQQKNAFTFNFVKLKKPLSQVTSEDENIYKDIYKQYNGWFNLRYSVFAYIINNYYAYLYFPYRIIQHK